MPQTLVVVSMPKKSGIPADRVQNSFAFAHTPALDAAGVANILGQLDDFYNTTAAGGLNPVNQWLGPSLAATPDAVDVNFYDITGHLNGSAHGAPTFTDTLTIGGAGTNGYPDEVAICVSFHSAFGADVEFGGGGTRPRARDRGRIYLGPLNRDCGAQHITTKELQVDSQVATDIASSAGALLGDPDYTWCVWTRAGAGLKPVTAGWVDNAFDTQRRRGQAPSVRTTF